MTENSTEVRPKRVLHIGKYFPPHRGGMETVLRDQMNMQTRDEGLQVAAVVHSSERRLTDKVEIQPLGYRVRYAARWFTAIFAPIAPFFWISLCKEIERFNPDEIILHMPNVSGLMLLFIPKARGIVLTVFWHSDVVVAEKHRALRLMYYFYKPLESCLLKKAAAITVTSRPYLESSAALERYRDKCKVVALVIDIARLPVNRKNDAAVDREPSGALRVLCVGRMTYYKNFEIVVQALSQIEHAQLRIVGNGPDKNHLIALIRKLKLESRVELLGELSDSDLWCQYSWCDVHCLPSIDRAEAFGVVTLEAAAFGKPTLAANIEGSGVAEAAIRAHKDSKLFEAGNLDNLTVALKSYSKPQYQSQ